jgi:hypothetical protein
MTSVLGWTAVRALPTQTLWWSPESLITLSPSQITDVTRSETLETKSKLDSKSTRKMKHVQIMCGYPHV